MSKFKITFIGHATCLIEIDGKFFLTDPNFSKKVLFVKRAQEPGIRPQDLPPLTALLVTHAHYDHLDLFSYKYFSSDIPIILPEGLGAFVSKFLKNPIIEIPAWGEHELEGVQIHAVPVKHQGFRLCGLTWRATTGYIIGSKTHKIFFPGDTAYGDHFKQISNLHNIDTALLPIGAYEPQWIMKSRHMNPPEALKAFADLQAKTLIPYHFGAFKISQEPLEAPSEWMKKLLEEKPNEAVRMLDPGESYEKKFVFDAS